VNVVETPNEKPEILKTGPFDGDGEKSLTIQDFVTDDGNLANLILNANPTQ